MTFAHHQEYWGPKRKQGDYQIPEGFYHIDRYNPYSVFYLSLGINYPNKSDRILGKKGSLGGDIFIHGDCVSIGCIPITTPKIKELYVMCVEAKNNGQKKIPVTIFPAKLTERNYKFLTERYSEDTDKLNLWKALKDGYQYFEKEKKLPGVTFLNNGRYKVSS
jgi:murein L,D-transpeptidase YafK